MSSDSRLPGGASTSLEKIQAFQGQDKAPAFRKSVLSQSEFGGRQRQRLSGTSYEAHAKCGTVGISGNLHNTFGGPGSLTPPARGGKGDSEERLQQGAELGVEAHRHASRGLAFPAWHVLQAIGGTGGLSPGLGV